MSDKPKKAGLGLKMKKNLAGKLGSKEIKKFIDDERLTNILDELHKLVEIQSDEKTADSIIK
eukprot:Pgem_evm1s2419